MNRKRASLFAGPLVASLGVVLALGACNGDDEDGDMIMEPNNSPTVLISAPAAGAAFDEGEQITFQGTATDPEDGDLTGAALVWTSNVDGQLGTGASITVSNLSVGAHTITLTATDSDGASASAQVQIGVAAPADQSPTASIAAPSDGSEFEEGEDVTFQGSATDPEDGDLTGAALVWMSDIDGQLGTGASITVSNLSVGDHTITLTATDSDGGTGSASIQVTILEPAQSGTIDLDIVDDAFVDLQGRTNQDAHVRITAGSTVRWTYDAGGITVHTVTSGEGQGGGSGDGLPPGAAPFASGNLSPGDTFEVTLDVVGLYTYFCEVHPTIMFNATIEVVAP